MTSESIRAELDEIARQFANQIEPMPLIEPPKRLGRPRKKVRWVIPVRIATVQRTAIAEEVRRWMNDDIAQERAERLHLARSARVTQTQATGRKRRLISICVLLVANATWAEFSDLRVARILKKTHPTIQLDTLRKDVAKARKLARLHRNKFD